MGTTIHPEISEKNKYWIDKHRYYELKHFCLQYPIWKRKYLSYDGYSRHPLSDEAIQDNARSDPTVKCVELREYYLTQMQMVERAAANTDIMIGTYILLGVTEGLTYNVLKMKYNVPCCRDTYYKLYRRFFWLLSQERK